MEHCSSRLSPVERRSNPLSVLEDLFDFSIVAYQKTGGAGGGSEYIWRYMDPRSRFDKDAMYFKVHPGLLEALDSKKYAHKK